MRNFRRFLGVLAVAVGLLLLLDFLLYPCTFMRNDIHAVTTNGYDTIYLGTSHGKMGIDPAAVEEVNGRNGHNICVGGEYCVDIYHLAKLILEKGEKPERFVLELSPDYLITEKEEGNNYLLFYHEFPLSMTKLSYFRAAIAKTNLRTVFFPWYEYALSYELSNMKETARKKWSKDFSAEGMKTETQEYHENGFIERFPIDTDTLDPEDLEELYIPYPEDLLEENMQYLDKLTQLCREQGVELVALITPVPQVTMDYFYDGYQALDAYFSEYFAERDVRYINFNSDELYAYATHDLTDYTDLDGHLNGDAARAFSAQLARVLDLPEEEWEIWETEEPAAEGEEPEEDWEEEDWEEEEEEEDEDALG